MRYSSQVITHSALFILFVWIMFCQRSPHHPLARLWLNSALAIRCYLITKYTFNSTLSQTTILVLIVFFFFSLLRNCIFNFDMRTFFPNKGRCKQLMNFCLSQLVGLLCHPKCLKDMLRLYHFGTQCKEFPKPWLLSLYFSNSFSFCAQVLASSCHLCSLFSHVFYWVAQQAVWV